MALSFTQGETRKLAKLTILSVPSTKPNLDFSSIASAATSITGLLGSVPLVFEAMYNPTAYSQNYEVVQEKKEDTSVATPPLQLKRVDNKEVTFKFLIDGTGASPSASFYGKNLTSTLATATKGVDVVIEYFLKVVSGLNKDTHDVNNLTLIWGVYMFKGRIKSVNVSYKMFDRIGRPIRAEIDATFIQHEGTGNSIFSIFKKSPDVTKTRVVVAGDTLPLIAKNEYEDESLYIELARINNLKNYRKLIPGQILVLPPFNKNAES